MSLPALFSCTQLLPRLLRKWEPSRDSPRLYLTNLVTAAHDMFKMAKSLAAVGAVVLSHRRKTKQKKPDGEEGNEEGTRAFLALSAAVSPSCPPPVHYHDVPLFH